jgi:hypothetical protein
MPGRSILLVLTVLASACGGAETERAREQPKSTPAAGTLEALWKRPGTDVAIVPGTNDYAPGSVRVAFLVLTPEGKPVDRPRARFWIARRLKAKPFAETTATLERLGTPGGYDDDFGVKNVYVAHLDIAEPGKYWVLAEPVGARIQALGNVVVAEQSASPRVGARAVPSETPTVASTGGDLAALTTRKPPDRELLQHSVADSLAARKPFVVTFSTPKFCTSRVCGPVVDVVDAVRRETHADPRRRDVRFIHVEVYEGNDPQKGVNRWMKEWDLPSEPWTFVVGRDGRIKAKFEGPVSLRELREAVRRHLL